jgi:hypothetical protein
MGAPRSIADGYVKVSRWTLRVRRYGVWKVGNRKPDGRRGDKGLYDDGPGKFDMAFDMADEIHAHNTREEIYVCTYIITI